MEPQEQPQRLLRSQRNRKRSKRRQVFCPKHGCYLESSSQKFRLYLDQPGQLQEKKGLSAKTARLVVATYTTVPLTDEWLERFWCVQCQSTCWYHVHRLGQNEYELTVAPAALWKQVSGVIDPRGNPSVSEFTLRESRAKGVQGNKQWRYVP